MVRKIRRTRVVLEEYEIPLEADLDVDEQIDDALLEIHDFIIIDSKIVVDGSSEDYLTEGNYITRTAENIIWREAHE